LRLKKILAFMLITVIALVMSACNSNIALFINAKQGDSYNYHVEMNQTNNLEYAGEQISTKQNMSTDFSITVDDIDSDGNMTLNYTYSALKFETESNGEKQVFDSGNVDPDDPVSAVYNSIIGKGFTAKMTKSGEVKEIGGVDELLDSMIDSVDVGDSEIMKARLEELREGLKESFGEETLKASIEQSVSVLPKDKNIKVGDTWTVKDNVESIVNMDVDIYYTLDKIEKGIAYISVKSDYKTDSSEAIEFMGLKVLPDLVCNTTGTIKVNIENGFLSEGELDVTLAGKLAFDMPELEIDDAEEDQITLESTMKVIYSTSNN